MMDLIVGLFLFSILIVSLSLFFWRESVRYNTVLEEQNAKRIDDEAKIAKQTEDCKNQFEAQMKWFNIPIADLANLAIDIAGSIDHTPLERVLEIAQKNNDGEQAIDEFCMEYSGQIESGIKRLASKRSEKKDIKIDFDNPEIKALLNSNVDSCLRYVKSIISDKVGYTDGVVNTALEGFKIKKKRNWADDTV